MLRLKTLRRRLLLCAGRLLVLSGLSLIVVHSSLVRRYVLVQAQIRLGNATGLIIDARGLDYDLFRSRFELHDIGFKGAQLTRMPAPLRARRVELKIPVWQLLHGKFDGAQITIDGLSVHRLVDRKGRTNWPSVVVGGGTSAGGGPTVLVTSGELFLQDDPHDMRLRLPLTQASGAWDRGSQHYAVRLDAAAGSVVWNDRNMPIDAIHVQSTFSRGSRSAIDARAHLSLANGRTQGQISGTGPIDCPRVKAGFRVDRLEFGGIALERPAVEALFNPSSGELVIPAFSAATLGGRLTAGGRIWTAASPGRSELSATLNGFDVQRAARLAGIANAPAGRASLQFHASCSGAH